MVIRFESNYFRFESIIVSNYVLNRGRGNSIVKKKASKPIVLELKPNAGKDRLRIGLVSISLWLNKGNIVSSNQPPVDQSVLNATML